MKEILNLFVYFFVFQDLPGVIDRVCKFLGKEYTREQKDKLNEYLQFDNMKKKSPSGDEKKDSELTFIRKGM